MSAEFISPTQRAIALAAAFKELFELPCKHPLVTSLRQDRGMCCSECGAPVRTKVQP